MEWHLTVHSTIKSTNLLERTKDNYLSINCIHSNSDTMAKKFLIQFMDKHYDYMLNLRKYANPIYGEITDSKLDEMIAYGKRVKAQFIIVKNVSKEGISTSFVVDLVKGRYHKNASDFKGYALINGRYWVE